MKEEIVVAVATLSGSAYYGLVKELKKRGIAFISLNPNSKIPIHINLVLTTKEEHHLVNHSNVISYDEKEDVAEIIDKAIQIAYRIQEVRKLTIGVDPGKKWGLSAIADDLVLHSNEYISMKDVEDRIQKLIAKINAEEYIVKIGNGSEPYHSQLISRLNESLPREVIIESVQEEGTSSNLIRKSRRNNAESAERISSRKGKRIPRK
ncbi:MAG: hypothetical protein JSW01_01735 [Candidatus Bathyarchaeota archaeon]|nr:MAG: hypothetical protein JSW01_01735 [Candidatus Bathyarchaeota archaeon]